MKTEQTQPYSGFVKAVSFALKQFRLYSNSHPITQQAIQTLSTELEHFFSAAPKISLGSMRKLLVVDGEITSEKDPAAKDFAGELDRLGIESLIINKGITLDEMTVFLTMMAMRAKTIEEKGGFHKVFEAAALPHIRLSRGKYALVEEGKILADEGAKVGVEGSGPETGPAAVSGGGKGAPISMAEIIRRIREGDSPTPVGVAGSPAAEVDCERILVQLEKEPQEVAKLALENAQKPEDLEFMIRRVVQFLTEGLITFLVEQGRDISKALEKLAKELEKALDKMGESEEVEKLKKKIPGIFLEASDEIRVQMMVHAYKKDPEDAKGMQKLAGKLFKDQEVRGRLGPYLQSELSSVGMPVDETQGLLGQIEDKEAKKKQKVTVDAAELADLRLKAKKFDEELKKAVRKVEREKKVLADEKERVESVIRNLAEGLLVVDKDGKVVLMNPAAERMLGVKKEQKIGRAVTDGLREEQVVAMASGNLRDPGGDVSKHVEVVSVNDDTKRILQTSTAVIENENGQTVGMVSVLSDVTRQKELEELKTKFVANVSHELRTPLVAIQKSLGLILTQELGEINPEQAKFLNIAHRNIERLSRLINDLLDISKIEAGGMRLNARAVRVRELAGHVASTMETWVKDKKIKIEMKFPDPEIEVEADPDRLTQVLTNLMGNAVKFTPDNGTLTLEAARAQDPQTGMEMVEIGVRDTGIGIDPEDLEKIFEKFVQVGLAQPAGVSSTGLGLTITKEIVELHGGKIWVESEVGTGSRFAFRIPAKFKVPAQN